MQSYRDFKDPYCDFKDLIGYFFIYGEHNLKYIGGVPIDFNFILKTISEHYAVEIYSVMVG